MLAYKVFTQIVKGKLKTKCFHLGQNVNKSNFRLKHEDKIAHRSFDVWMNKTAQLKHYKIAHKPTIYLDTLVVSQSFGVLRTCGTQFDKAKSLYFSFREIYRKCIFRKQKTFPFRKTLDGTCNFNKFFFFSSFFSSDYNIPNSVSDCGFFRFELIRHYLLQQNSRSFISIPIICKLEYFRYQWMQNQSEQMWIQSWMYKYAG